MEHGYSYLALASYRRCVERMREAWPGFIAARQDRLRQAERYGIAFEKVTEAILEDLFTQVLDWNKGDLDYQVGHADIVLVKNFVKYLVVEAKRPGALAWHRPAISSALSQASKYAQEQSVSRIAVSDGVMLYARDLEHGVVDHQKNDRLFVRLDRADTPLALWWLSVHGIYRDREGDDDRELIEDAGPTCEGPFPPLDPSEIMHPKYKLPARCFGYVGNAADPHTWKLPHLSASGAVDEKRLPKAIQAIISNYRGVKVGGIPEPAIPDVLVKLALAAKRIGKLPGQGAPTAQIYEQLTEVLKQLGRLDAVLPAT